MGRRGGGHPLRRAERRVDVRLRAFDGARPGRRRHAHARVRAAGGRARRRDAALAGDDREDGGRRRRARRRQGGARSAGAADGRRASQAPASLRRARRIARRHVSHGRRHEHRARRPRHREGDGASGCTERRAPAATAAAGRRSACCTAFARRSSTCSGRPTCAGRRVLVQGAGAVGNDLARFLAAAGAEVLVSDVDEARAAAAGGTFVPAGDALSTECDVYSPCAVGGTLNAETIPQLRCRIVAGSANNQLATPEDAQRLHDARDPLRARLRRSTRAA